MNSGEFKPRLSSGVPALRRRRAVKGQHHSRLPRLRKLPGRPTVAQKRSLIARADPASDAIARGTRDTLFIFSEFTSSAVFFLTIYGCILLMEWTVGRSAGRLSLLLRAINYAKVLIALGLILFFATDLVRALRIYRRSLLPSLFSPWGGLAFFALGFAVWATLLIVRHGAPDLAPLNAAIIISLGVAWFFARRVSLAASGAVAGYHPDELPALLHMRVLGMLPDLPPHPRRSDRFLSELIEEVDRVVLLLSADKQIEKAGRRLLITSARDGEGKTSLAAYLATGFLRSGWRVLLIDGDLRTPTLHRICGVPLSPGLSEILRGEINYEACLMPTNADGLSIIPAGQVDSQVLTALTMVGGLRTVLEYLENQFDLIVIDSSPVLPVSDTLKIGQSTHGAILSVGYDETGHLPSIQRAKDRLHDVGIPLIGAVVTRIPSLLFDEIGTRYWYGFIPTRPPTSGP
jgi:capsular exopolysaccharide synthesis family protein